MNAVHKVRLFVAVKHIRGGTGWIVARVSADVIDGPQSVVWDEAENRLHTSVAVLRYLLG